MVSEVMGDVCSGIKDSLVDFQQIRMSVDSFHNLKLLIRFEDIQDLMNGIFYFKFNLKY